MNFANKMQSVVVDGVTARQFLQTEAASSAAFQVGAEQSALVSGPSEGASEVFKEAVKREKAALTIDPQVFEKDVKDFLRSIWLEGKDADNEINKFLAEKGSEYTRILGKAADAIEARCGVRWGFDSRNQAIIDAIS